jgi:hypothetical protein
VEKTARFYIQIVAQEGWKPLLRVTLTGWTWEKELALRAMTLQLLLDAQAVIPGLTLAAIVTDETTGSEATSERFGGFGSEE